MSQRAIWYLLVGSCTIAGVLLGCAGLRLNAGGIADAIVFIPASLAVGMLCRNETDGRMRRIALTLETIAALTLVSLCGSVASYCVVRMSHGFADDLLARADQWLGFDWPALYRFTMAHASVQLAGRCAYFSIFWTPAIVAAGLVMRGHEELARRFVVTFGMTLWCTVAIFPFFPARSALIHYAGSAHAYMPVTGIGHVRMIEGLRAGSVRVIDLGNMLGLISFPSFHACSAVLFAWGAWPLRRLRYVVLTVEAAMLMATPIEGTHYFVDVLGGVACALLCIGVVGVLTRRGARVPTASAVAPAISAD